ncbi:MAG: HmuY family protein [Persicimonas sp.]
MADAQDASTDDAETSEPDADDGAGSNDSCDPEEVAADQVAENATVNDGSVSFDSDGEVQMATIDASSGGVEEAADHSFIYLDLQEGEELELSDEEAFGDADWTIGVRRAVIRLNSGDSGPGPWMVTRIDENWEEAETPGRDADWREDDYVTEDCEVVTEGRDTIRTGFGIWYDYDSETHEVSVPESTTWALYNSSTHQVIKFGIDSYDDATYEIRWGEF